MTRLLIKLISRLSLGWLGLILLALGVGEIMIVTDNELVFSAYLKKGNSAIYRMDIAHGLIYQLTSNPITGAAPVWSPDGQQIAFVSDYDNQSTLFVMDILGDKLHPLSGKADYVYNPAWSPDGRQIVFVNASQTALPELFTKDLESGASDQLTDNNVYEYTPAWSPDGQQIVFASDRTVPGNMDIFSLDMETKEIRPLMATQDNETNPVWSPDGRYLMYFTSGTNISMVIYDTLDAQPTRLYSATFADSDAPDWSPDGRFIVYSAFINLDTSAIFRLDAAACLQQPKTCTPQLLTVIPGYYQSPRWRPTQP